MFREITQYIIYKDKGHYKFAINKEKTHKDKVTKTQSSTMKYKKGLAPNLIGLDRKTVSLFAHDNKIDIEYKGFGIVVNQNPKPGANFSPSQKIFVELDKPAFE